MSKKQDPCKTKISKLTKDFKKKIAAKDPTIKGKTQDISIIKNKVAVLEGASRHQKQTNEELLGKINAQKTQITNFIDKNVNLKQKNEKLEEMMSEKSSFFKILNYFFTKYKNGGDDSVANT